MIRSEKAHLHTVAMSHPGMSGKNNEDRFAVSAYLLSQKNSLPVLLAVLADGIGGHRAGEVAAEIVVNRVSHMVAESDGSHPTAILQQAIVAASAEIYEQAQGDPDRLGMGSTCVCVLVLKDRLFAATVGDSRLYLVRGGAIRKLSTDHTWIQEALDAGVLNPDQVEGHPNAHVIRRYLGSPNPPEVDFRLRLKPSETNADAEGNQGMQLLPGDCLLMCSDGLSDLVKDAEILVQLTTHPLEEAVEALINLANERGGHDNITVIGLQMPEKPAQLPSTLPVKRIAIGCGVVVILAALLAGTVWGFLWLRGKQQIAPTATPTPTFILPLFGETATASPQPSPTSSPSPTPTQTLVPEVLPSLIIFPTLTPLPSLSPAPTETSGPRPSITITAVPAKSRTPSGAL